MPVLVIQGRWNVLTGRITCSCITNARSADYRQSNGCHALQNGCLPHCLCSRLVSAGAFLGVRPRAAVLQTRAATKRNLVCIVRLGGWEEREVDRRDRASYGSGAQRRLERAFASFQSVRYPFYMWNVVGPGQAYDECLVFPFSSAKRISRTSKNISCE